MFICYNKVVALQIQQPRYLLTPARFIRTVCTCRIWGSCEGLTSISQQINWIHLKHLLPMTMYNLSLPNIVCYNYCGLPTSMQLRANSDCSQADALWLVSPGRMLSGTVLHLAFVYLLDRKVHFGMYSLVTFPEDSMYI